MLSRLSMLTRQHVNKAISELIIYVRSVDPEITTVFSWLCCYILKADSPVEYVRTYLMFQKHLLT